MNIKNCFVLLLIFLSSTAFGQLVSFEQEARTDLRQYFEDNYKLQLQYIQEENKDIRKFIQERFKDRKDYQQRLVDEGSILIYPRIQVVLDSAVEIIKERNSLTYPYRIFLLSDALVNAYSTGDNNLFVTTGLLERLGSFEELVYVICHEISHDVKQHMYQTSKNTALLIYDKDIKKLSKTGSKNSDEGFKSRQELRSRIAGTKRFSRRLEYEADSLGKILYKELNFPESAIASVLLILDESDLEPFKGSVDLRSLIVESGMEPQPQWFIDKVVSSLNYDSYDRYVVPDSMKTHPNIPDRISRLDLDIEEAKIDTMHLSFEPFVRLAERETDIAWMAVGNYGRTFYRCAIRHQKRPSSLNNTFMSINASLLCISLRKRTLGTHLSLENLEYGLNYNSVLHLLNEMNSSELAAFGKGLLPAEETEWTAEEKEFYATAKLLTIYCDKNQAAFDAGFEDFQSKFPNACFIRYLRNLTLQNKP